MHRHTLQPVRQQRVASAPGSAQDGSTALHQAAFKGFTDNALALISIGGARIDAVDKYSSTPLPGPATQSTAATAIDPTPQSRYTATRDTFTPTH